jgi:hypothetical protein
MTVKMLFSVLCCLVLVFAGCEADKSSVANDEKIGDGIIAALEKYKAEQGLYPDTLTQLIPNYVRQIAPPRYGARRWDYVHYCKNDSFALFMWGRRADQDAYWYDSEKKQWGLIENSF